jgi:hypothetical protein
MPAQGQATPQADANASTEFGQGGKTPLGYFGRAWELFSKLHFAAMKNGEAYSATPDLIQAAAAAAQAKSTPERVLSFLLGLVNPKAGSAVATTPRQAVEFVKGNTQALPGAKDVMFDDQTIKEHPYLTGAAGWTAEALTNPLNLLTLEGGTVAKGLNMTVKGVSAAELATQGKNLIEGKPVNPVNTTFAALPFAAPALMKLPATQNLMARLKGKVPGVPESVQQAFNEEAVTGPIQRFEEMKPTLLHLEKQVAQEGAQLGKGATGREQLGKIMFERSRKAAAKGPTLPAPEVVKPTAADPALSKQSALVDAVRERLSMKAEQPPARGFIGKPIPAPQRPEVEQLLAQPFADRSPYLQQVAKDYAAQGAEKAAQAAAKTDLFNASKAAAGVFGDKPEVVAFLRGQTTSVPLGELSDVQRVVLDDLQEVSQGAIQLRNGQLVRVEPQVPRYATPPAPKLNIGKDPTYAATEQLLAGQSAPVFTSEPESADLFKRAVNLFSPGQGRATTAAGQAAGQATAEAMQGVQAVLRGEALEAHLPEALTPSQQSALAALSEHTGGALRVDGRTLYWEFPGGQIPPNFPGASELSSGPLAQVPQQAAQAAASPQPLTYGSIKPGETAYDTYQAFAKTLPDLAAQAGLPDFNRRTEYFHLSGQGDKVPYLQRVLNRLRGQAPVPNPVASEEALAGATSAQRGFMRPQNANTVPEYEAAMAAREMKPVWDPTRSLADRVQQQLKAEGMQKFLRRIAENSEAAMPLDQAPPGWVDLAKTLSTDHPAVQAFGGLALEPNVAKYVLNLTKNAENPGLALEGLDRFQNFYRRMTFYNPFDVAKRFGAQSAELGLGPADLAQGVREALRKGSTPAKDALLQAGVLRPGLSNAEHLATQLSQEAGTQSLARKVWDHVPIFNPVANERIEGKAADAAKIAAFVKLVREGKTPAEAATLAGQAFGNPQFLKAAVGPGKEAVAKRLFLTPNWMLQNMGFQLRMLAENPAGYWRVARQVPETLQRAIAGTEQADNPTGKEGYISMGPPDESGIQPFLNPSLPTKDPYQLAEAIRNGPYHIPVDFVGQRLAPVPRLFWDAVAGRDKNFQENRQAANLPPDIQATLDESRRVPMLGSGQQGYGPLVSPESQRAVERLLPVLPGMARSTRRDTLLRDLVLELMGMYPSDLDTGAQARGQVMDTRGAVSEIRSNLRKRAQQQTK